MSMIESRASQSPEDWGVVIQSVPAKSKKNVLKQLEKIFHLDKRSAEQVLANMPLILIDDLSFGLAVRIKKHFLDLGVVSETTNHDMIKKNCFQVVWPKAPDLAFFQKEEGKEDRPPEVFSSEKTAPMKPEPIAPPANKPAPQEYREDPRFDKKRAPEKLEDAAPAEIDPVFDKSTEVPPVREKPSFVYRAEVPPAESKPDFAKPTEIPPAEIKPAVPPVVEDLDKPRILEDVLAEELPPEVSEPVTPQALPESVTPAPSVPSAIDPDWERRAKELNEKLRWIQEEKHQLREQHVEETEKVKNELQERITQEKQKNSERRPLLMTALP